MMYVVLERQDYVWDRDVVNAVNAKNIVLNQMIRKEWKEFAELVKNDWMAAGPGGKQMG